ncbi:lipopolysaccharide biosynthesis protein [Marispirochaeta aestuarii]|uniref:lipopolysaccharide biosynthesis protein n=1 Tax=Marispirochaeta aestuarii TaxID=1963862 RepID=UPI002FCDEADC
MSAVIARGINLIILIWLQQYLLRRISAAEYSIYPVVLSVMMLVTIVRTILTSGVARYITEAYSLNDIDGVKEMTSTMVILQVSVATVLFVAGLFFSLHVNIILNIKSQFVLDAKIMFGIMVFSFCLQLALMPFTVGLFVKQKFILINVFNVLTTIFRALLLFFLLTRISNRVLWVVVSMETANIIRLSLTVFFSKKALPELRFSFNSFSWERGKKLLSYGGWAFVGRIANRIRTSADPIILNKFATPFDVTSFHLGFLFQKQIEDALLLITEPIMPGLTSLYVSKDFEKIRRTFTRFGRYATWAVLFFSIPVMVFNQEFMRLYVGEKYLLAGTVSLLILGSEILTLGIRMTHKIAVASGQIKPVALRSIFMQIINLLLTLYLVGYKQLGAFGSALSTALVFIFIKPFLEIPLGLKLAHLGYKQWIHETIIPGNMPAVISFMFLLFLKVLKTPDSWFLLGIETLIGLGVYVFVLLKFCLMSNDKEDLKKLFERKYRKLRKM